MDWVALIAAGLFEVLGVMGLNHIKRDNDAKAYVLFGIAFTMSFICLGFSMKTMPIGTAYAIWTGIGTAGGVLVGMVFFRESVKWQRILFIGMILIATVGLKLIS